jgi:hypothetical protein
MFSMCGCVHFFFYFQETKDNTIEVNKWLKFCLKKQARILIYKSLTNYHQTKNNLLISPFDFFIQQSGENSLSKYSEDFFLN